MIIKEKRWLSRFVAMLCVLTMVVGVLTPASVGVAVTTQVKKIKITVPKDIEIYDADLDLINAENSNNSVEARAESLAYTYEYQSGEQNILTFTTGGESGYFNTGDIMFFAKSDLKPEIQHEIKNGLNVNINKYDKLSNGWKITLTISKTLKTDPLNLSISKASPEYTISFPEDNGYTLELQEPSNFDFGSHSVTVKEKESVKFKVNLNEENHNKKVTVMVYGQSKFPDENGVYIIEVIRDTTVSISLDDKTYTIDESEIDSNKGYLYMKDTLSTTITHGNDFRFYVYPKDGYDAPTVKVKTKQENGEFGNEETLIGYNNFYVISNIQADKKIVITSGSQKNCNILFSSGTGYTIKDETGNNEIHNDSTVYNTSYSFTVEKAGGYEILNVIATSNAGTQVLYEKEGKYTIERVTSDITVTVNVRKESYTVQYPSSGIGYTIIKGAENAEYGEFVTFNVKPSEGYLVPTVKANNEIISPADGTQYRVEIKGNTEITVENVKKDNRKITFNDKTGYYDFKDFYVEETNQENAPQTVPYGSTVKFKVNLDLSCDQSEGKYTVKANGAKLTIKDGYYIIDEITENQVIEVEGVEKNKYTVTLQNDMGYTLGASESTQVSAGNNFSFSWRVDDGYEASKLVVKETIGGKEISEYSDDLSKDVKTGNKTIKIDKDITIRLEVSPITCVVTIPKEESVKANVNAVNDVNSNSVPYNGSYSFKVTPKEYYKLIDVTVDGVPLEAISGVYTIGGIKEDKEIIIKTEPVKLTVHYVDDKYNTEIPDTEYTIVENCDTSSGKVNSYALEKISDTDKLYTFTGWNNSDKAAIDKFADTEITLTAKWKLKKSLLSNENIKLTTKGSINNSKFEDGATEYEYTLTFKSLFELIENLNENVENIKITGCGTFYSDEKITVNDDCLNNISSRERAPKSNLYKLEVNTNTEQRMFNYYTNVTDLSVSELDETNNFFSLNLGTNNNMVKRYAVGWVEFTIGTDTIVIYSDNSCSIPEN